MEHWRLAQRLGKGILRRRKRLALGSFVGALVIASAGAYSLSKEPPRYRASATVLLESRPDRIPIFQELSPMRPLAVQLAILRSRSLAEAVIDSLPRTALQDLMERQYHVDYMGELLNAYRRFRGIEPEVENPQRRALSELQQARMKFESKGDGIVEISAEASKPQAAIDIVNTYTEVLLSRTRSFNVDDARTSREFLEQHLADIKRNLTASEESLRAFTVSHGGVKIPERSQAAVGQVTQAETALAEVAANRRTLEARLRVLRQKVDTQKPMPSTPVIGPSAASRTPPPEIQRLRSQLSQLETALLDLRTRFTDAHPRVTLIKGRIAEVQRQLAEVVKETTPTTPAPGAVPPAERINFAEQVIVMETALHAVSAQEDALRSQADTFRQSLSGLSRSELQYTSLVRDVESHRNLHALLAEKLTAARIREQGEMKVVKVIDAAAHATATTSEKRVRLLGLAAVLALAVGGAVPAGVEWIQRTVETEGDVEATAGLPVLAVLPHLRSGGPKFLAAAEPAKRRLDEGFIFAEAVRNLRVTIQLSPRPERPRTFLVTSPFAAEGKSTVLVNLGMAFSEAGYRVVLADTDFHRPTLHHTLKVSASSGLAEALETHGDIDETLVPVGDRMWMAPRGGSLQPQARGMLATNRLKMLIDEMAHRADVVLCDSSPVLLIPDNLFLAAAVDGVILVAKAGSTRCRDIVQAKTLLEAAGATILGVVINGMPVSALRRHYDRYYKTYIKREAL